MLLESAEAAVYLAAIMFEVTGVKLKVRWYIDNKGLHLALCLLNAVSDKRLRLDLAVLRDMLDKEEIEKVSWLDGSHQLADCLTRRGASTQKLQAAMYHS